MNKKTLMSFMYIRKILTLKQSITFFSTLTPIHKSFVLPNGIKLGNISFIIYEVCRNVADT